MAARATFNESSENLEPPVVKWIDASPHESEVEDKGAPVDDQGFLSRQMRRISEHPKISQIQLARQTSKHKITFLRKALSIMANTMIFKFFFIIFRCIPVSKVIMAAIFFKKCPVEPMITLYILVGGIASCIQEMGMLCAKKCLHEDCLLDFEVSLSLMAVTYSLAEFVWFIIGSVYVFKTYGNYQGTDSTKPDYCHPVMYMYSLVVTAISYFLLFTVIFISCCAMCLARMSDKSKSRKKTLASDTHIEHDTQRP